MKIRNSLFFIIGFHVIIAGIIAISQRVFAVGIYLILCAFALFSIGAFSYLKIKISELKHKNVRIPQYDVEELIDKEVNDISDSTPLK